MALDFFAAQAGSYSAETTRRAMFSWAARTGANSPGIIAGGLMSTSDLTVSAPVSGMTVNIAAGEAMIGGNEGGSQGGYYFRNSATFSAGVAAANASLPRIDAIVATMTDAGYTQPSDAGGTANGGVLAVITGSPTSGATLSNLTGAPAIPGSSLLLGYCFVPASATNIITADIANVASMVQAQGHRLLLSAPGPGSGNETTTSMTLINGLKFGYTVNCSGAPLKIDLDAFLSISTPSGLAVAGPFVDGAITSPLFSIICAATATQSCHGHTVWTPTPGSHTFGVSYGAAVAGTATFYDTAASIARLTIVEMT